MSLAGKDPPDLAGRNGLAGFLFVESGESRIAWSFADGCGKFQLIIPQLLNEHVFFCGGLAALFLLSLMWKGRLCAASCKPLG